ncbi:MAG: hemolysin family protein [Lachnospiraceae bacterium]|nr:hemolysin family protein [Lachnospiraceae bacterium]
MDPYVIQSISLVVLLFLSAFFSSAETALVKVNKIRMRSLVDEGGNRKAAKVLEVTEDNGKMLSAILIGNNIVNISASALATTITTNLFGNAYIALATGLLTLLVLIFGEISPKTLATIHADSMAMFYAPIIGWLMWILTPVIWIVNHLARAVLVLLRVDPDAKHESITEDELRTYVEVGHEEGVIEQTEKQIINNVFDFGDALAKEVMIPRVDMSFVSVESSYEEILEIFRQEKYTRFPVYEETRDNVVGIINVKDLLMYDNKDEFQVKDILREPYYCYEFKNVSELMQVLRKTSTPIAIILDEYGSTVGMITMEDLLEELVGEIRDEYDDNERDDIVEVGVDEYLIDGATRLDDFNELAGTNIESEDYDSIGGFFLENLDSTPTEGDRIVLPGIELHVEKVDKNRIETLRVFLNLSNEEEMKDEDEDDKHHDRKDDDELEVKVILAEDVVDEDDFIKETVAAKSQEPIAN